MKNLSKYILPIGPINDLMGNKDDLSSFDNTERFGIFYRNGDK